ncbi:ABC transporter substrate-binding protein [Saccharibacillus kuerlensis]|uniref:ABC transporter substrate-binding protein n=1 Tax=Saccharibacillus kuerlensis TaxID=459527 RepID=A0ABQ2KV21_9BACL|nr:ABC transporter substrate-binding protein [Saccharibacillus kuerlensis]GGN94190.1 hypothetical protein GCM10010969_08710 [Saccharibacillus kuerlensis]
MKRHKQFLLLHERYGEEGFGAEGAQLTLAEIAETLDCTHRSALTVIREIAEAGWIVWSSHRGRGKRSGLSFCVTPQEIAAESVADAIGRGDIRGIAGELGDGDPPPAMRERLRDSLRAYFGHHSETSTGRQIDTLRFPIRQQLHSLDPLRMNLLAESFVAGHVFDGLVRQEHGSDHILPALAHHWECGEDGRLWTFYLRKGVSFHDGKILTSEDVTYTFERMRRLPERVLYGFMFRNIEAVSAAGPLVVKIRLRKAHTLFLSFLCTSRAAILPKNALRQDETAFGLRPIGTGPFRVSEFGRDLCVLEAFTPYYLGRAHLDRVEIVNIPWRIQGGEWSGSESDSPFHILPGGGPEIPEAARASLRSEESGEERSSGSTVGNPKQNRTAAEFAQAEGASGDGKRENAGHGEGWSRAHAEVFSRKFVTCNTKSGPLRDPALRAAVMAALTEQEAAPAAEHAACPQLRLLTIPQYRQDAALIRERLERYGYSCRVIIVTVDDFKGRTRLATDLLLFSLIRDRDEQLRLFDLYLTLSEHSDSKTRLFIRNALRRASAKSTPRQRAVELDGIEAYLIAGHQLCVLYETPLQTGYLPSVRGVSFGAQGWINLRTVWFPARNE